MTHLEQLAEDIREEEPAMTTRQRTTPGTHQHEHHEQPDADTSGQDMGHVRHESHTGHDKHTAHDKHAGHDPEMFRRLFWWNLLLAIPVVVFSHMIQEWFGYSIDAAWAAWVPPVIGTVIYLWGGQPFLKGAMSQHFSGLVHPERRALINELRNRGVIRIEERANQYADHPYSVIVLDSTHPMVVAAGERMQRREQVQ